MQKIIKRAVALYRAKGFTEVELGLIWAYDGGRINFSTQVEAAKKLGVCEQTLIRWKKEYGGLRVDQAKRLKEPEKENARLKRLVADSSLDDSILNWTKLRGLVSQLRLPPI